MLFTMAQIGLLVAAGLVRSFWPFVVVVALLGVADSGETVSRGALVAGVMGRQGRVRLSAYIRSVFNLGFTLGIFLAGLALAADARPAYLSLIWGHALALLIVLPIYLGVPHVPGVPAKAKAGEKPVSALRDLPYFTLGQVSGITRLGDTAFTVALPLWIVSHTSVPRAFAAWVIGLNTVMVVLLQVRAARSAETLSGAVRLQRWSFIALATGCALVGLAGAVPTWPTIGVLVVVTVFITFGEMWGEGARWSLRYELAPQHAQGQYGGVFRLGQIMPAAIGPLLVTTLTEHLEAGGWLAIAVVFLLGLGLNRFVVPWAVRSRQSTPEDSPTATTGH
jgi:MFS family permease